MIANVISSVTTRREILKSTGYLAGAGLLAGWLPRNLTAAIQSELRRHTWDTFVDEGLTMALGGRGIVTPGCELCRKRINTNRQYLTHLAEDVLLGILESALNLKGAN